MPPDDIGQPAISRHLKVLTKPEFVKKWLLGPPSMPVCDIDLRVGGRYRYVWRNDFDWSEFGEQGQFREIAPPHRLAHTESMDGARGEALCTSTFVESGAQTLFTLNLLFESREARDGALQSGTTEGMSMSYDGLQDFVNNEQTLIT